MSHVQCYLLQLSLQCITTIYLCNPPLKSPLTLIPILHTNLNPFPGPTGRLLVTDEEYCFTHIWFRLRSRRYWFQDDGDVPGPFVFPGHGARRNPNNLMRGMDEWAKDLPQKIKELASEWTVSGSRGGHWLLETRSGRLEGRCDFSEIYKLIAQEMQEAFNMLNKCLKAYKIQGFICFLMQVLMRI